MSSSLSAGSATLRLGIGFAAGVAIAAVDNFTAQGEVSPIVVVALLLLATGVAGARWGRNAWPAALGTWVCIPLAHVVKRALGLPDTLHPSTWASIVMLASFTLGVAALGTATGALVRRALAGAAEPAA